MQRHERRKERKQWPNETPLPRERHTQALDSLMQSHFLGTFIMLAKLKPDTFNMHGWANLAMQAYGMRDNATAQNREAMDGEAEGE